MILVPSESNLSFSLLLTLSPPCVDTVRRQLSIIQEESPHLGTVLAATTLIWISKPPELWKINSCDLSHSADGILLCQPKLSKTYGKIWRTLFTLNLQLPPLSDETAPTILEDPLVTSYEEIDLQGKISSLYPSLLFTTSLITRVRSQNVLGTQWQSQSLVEKAYTPMELLESTKILGICVEMNSKDAQTSVHSMSTFTRDSGFDKLIQVATSGFNWCLDDFPKT